MSQIAILALPRVSAVFIVWGAIFQSQAASTWKLNFEHDNLDESLKILFDLGQSPVAVAVSVL